MYNPALEKLRNQAEQRLHQKRMQQLEQYKQQTSMRSLFDPLLNVKAREKVGGTNWFETTALGYGELFKNLYSSWKNPGQGLINTLTFMGDSLDYAANLIKAPVLAIAKDEDVGERLADAYGLGDRGRITQNMSELREVIGAPTSGAVGGALTGAMIGTSISPGWGTLIGAGIGLAAGSVAGAAGYYDVEIANTLIDMSLEYASDPMNVVGAIKSGVGVVKAASNVATNTDDIVNAASDVFKNGDVIIKGTPNIHIRTTAQQTMYDFFKGYRKNVDVKTIKQWINDTIAAGYKEIDDTISYLEIFKKGIDDAVAELEMLKNMPNPDPIAISKAAEKLKFARKGYAELTKKYSRFRGVHKNWEIEKSININVRKDKIVKQYNKLQKRIFKSYYDNDYKSFSRAMAEAGIYKDYSGITDAQLKHVFKQLNREANKSIAVKFLHFMNNFDNNFNKFVLGVTPPGLLAVTLTKTFKMFKYLRRHNQPWKSAAERLYSEKGPYEYKPREKEYKKFSTPLLDSPTPKYEVAPYNSKYGNKVPDIEDAPYRKYYMGDPVEIPKTETVKPDAKTYVPTKKTQFNYSNLTSVERNNIYVQKQEELNSIPSSDTEIRKEKIKELKNIPLGDHGITTYQFESSMMYLIRQLHNMENVKNDIVQLAKSEEIVRHFNRVMMFALYSGETGYNIFVDYLSNQNYNKELYKKLEKLYGEKVVNEYVIKTNSDSTSALLGTLFANIIESHLNNSAIKEYQNELASLSAKIKSSRDSIAQSSEIVNKRYQKLSDALTAKFSENTKPTEMDKDAYYFIQDALAVKNKDVLLESDYALSLQPEIDACSAAESKLVADRAALISSMDYFIRGYDKNIKLDINSFYINQIKSDYAKRYFVSIKKEKMQKAMTSGEVYEFIDKILDGVRLVISDLEKDGLTLSSFINTSQMTVFANPNSYNAKLYKTIMAANDELKNLDSYIDNFRNSFKSQLDFIDKYKDDADTHIKNLNSFIKLAEIVDESIKLNNSEKSNIIVKELFDFLMTGDNTKLNNAKGVILETFNMVGLSSLFLHPYPQIMHDLSKLDGITGSNSLASIFRSALEKFKLAIDIEKPIHIHNVVNRFENVIIRNQEVSNSLLQTFKEVFKDDSVYLAIASEIERAFKLYDEIGKCLVAAYWHKFSLSDPKFIKLVSDFKVACSTLQLKYSMYSSFLYLQTATSQGILYKYTLDKTSDIHAIIEYLNKVPKDNSVNIDVVSNVNTGVFTILKSKMDYNNDRIVSVLEDISKLSNDKINTIINDVISILKYAEVIKDMTKDARFSHLVKTYRTEIINVIQNIINNPSYNVEVEPAHVAYNNMYAFIENYCTNSLSKITVDTNNNKIIKPSDEIKTTTKSGFQTYFNSQKYYRGANIAGFNGLDFVKLESNAIRLTVPYGDAYKNQPIPKELYSLDPKKSTTLDSETTIASKDILQIAYIINSKTTSLLLFDTKYNRHGYDNLLSEDMVNGKEADKYNPIGFKEFKDGLSNSVIWTDSNNRTHTMYKAISDLINHMYNDIKPLIQEIEGKAYLILSGQNIANFDTKIILKALNTYTNANLSGVINIDLLPLIRSYTAIGTMYPEGVAKDFANMPNAKLDEVYTTLVERGAIPDVAGSAHEASTDTIRTELIKNKILKDFDTFESLIYNVNRHIDDFNNYWADKILDVMNGALSGDLNDFNTVESIDEAINQLTLEMNSYKLYLKTHSLHQAIEYQQEEIDDLYNQISILEKEVDAIKSVLENKNMLHMLDIYEPVIKLKELKAQVVKLENSPDEYTQQLINLEDVKNNINKLKIKKDNIKSVTSISKVSPNSSTPTLLVDLISKLDDTTYVGSNSLKSLINMLQSISKESFDANFNKYIHVIYTFLDEFERISRKIDYDLDNKPTVSVIGQYDDFIVTPEWLRIVDICDELRKVIDGYLEVKDKVMQLTFGDALVRPKQNSFLTNANILQTYPTFRNNPTNILIRKILYGSNVTDADQPLVGILNNYVHQFKSLDQFKKYHPMLYKFYDFQDRVDAYYNFNLVLYEYFDNAINIAAKDAVKLDKIYNAFGTIQTILYGTSKTNLSYDAKILNIIDSFNSTDSIEVIQKEISEALSISADNNLSEAVKIINPEGDLLNVISTYITDCVNNLVKYNIFSVDKRNRTILKPVMDSSHISMYYNGINEFIGVMKDAVNWKPNTKVQSHTEIDEAHKELIRIIEHLREPLAQARSVNTQLCLNGALPAGYVASSLSKNIYDINNGLYTVSFKRTNYADDLNSINAIEDKLLKQFNRDFSGVSDIIEFQPQLSRGKTLIKELFLNSNVSVNEMLVIMSYFKIDNDMMLNLCSEMFDSFLANLNGRVDELFTYYRNYLEDAQKLDVELMDKFKKYIKSVLISIEVCKNTDVSSALENISSPINHARMDAFNESQIYMAPNQFGGNIKKYYNNPTNDEVYENAYNTAYLKFKEKYVVPAHIRLVEYKARNDAYRDAFTYVFGNVLNSKLVKRTKDDLDDLGLSYYDEYECEYNKVLNEVYAKYKTKERIMNSRYEAAKAGRAAGREVAYQELYNNSKGVNIESDAAKAFFKYRYNDTVSDDLKDVFETEFKAEYDDFIRKHKARAEYYSRLQAERDGANKARQDAYEQVFNEHSKYKNSYDEYNSNHTYKDAFNDSYNKNYKFYEEKYYKQKQQNQYTWDFDAGKKRNQKINDYIDRLLSNETDLLTNALKSFREYKLQIINLFTDTYGNINWTALYNYVMRNNDLDFVVMYKSGRYRNRFTNQINAEIHTIHIKNPDELQEFMTNASHMYEFSIMDKVSILDLRKTIGHTGKNRYYKSNLLNNLVAVREWISYYIMSPLKQLSLFNIGFTVTNAIEGFIKTAIEAGGNPVTIFKHYQTANKLHKEYIQFSKAMTDVLEGSPFWRMKDNVKVLHYEQELGKMLFKNWEELMSGKTTDAVVRNVEELKELLAMKGSTINLPNYIKANMLKGVQRGNIDFENYAQRYIKVSKFITDELPKYNIENYHFVNEFINSSASAAEFQNIIIAEDLDKTGEKAKGIKKFYKKYLFSDSWLGDKNPLKYITPYAHLSRNSNIETINRLALYLSYGEQGFVKSEALTNVLATHFNYGNKSQAEMAAELLYPFISYPMRNYMYWMRALADHPSLLKTFIDFTMYNWGDEKDSIYNQTKITKGGIRLWNDVSVESGFSGYEALAFGGNALNVLNQRKLNPIIGTLIEGAKQLSTGESNLDYRFSRLPVVSHVQAGINLADNLIKGQPKLYDIAPSLFNEVYKNNRYYYANQGQYVYKSAYNRLFYTSGQRRTGKNQIRNMVIR